MIFNKTALTLGIASTLVFASCSKKDDTPDETPVNQAPTMSVSFSNGTYFVSATDPDNDALSYSWLIDDVSYGQSESFDPSALALSGTKTVTVQVSDSAGNVVTKDIPMTFGSTNPNPVNTVPVVNAGSAINAVAGTPFLLSATASDADGDTLNYSWSINNGQSATGNNQNITINSTGNYVATVTVSDGVNTVTDTVDISVTATQLSNQPPTISAGLDKSVNVNEAFTLSATATDNENDTLSFNWNVNGVNYPTQNPNVTLVVAGSYPAVLTVSDGTNTSTDTINITVKEVAVTPINSAPVIVSATASQTTLSASATDADNDPLTYVWKVGAITVGTGQSVSIASAPSSVTGSQTVVLTVSDGTESVTRSLSATFNSSTTPVTSEDEDTVNDYNGSFPAPQDVTQAAQNVVDAYDGSMPVPESVSKAALILSAQDGQEISGNVLYTPIPAGTPPQDVDPGYTVTIDENGDIELVELPFVHTFDYGDGQGYVLDDFNDNDHQNNVGGAKGTMHCENYTEGGGYWYVFAGESSSVENGSGLPINAYNIIEAVQDYHLNVKLVAGPGDNGYAGVGTNIVFEEHPVNLGGLDKVRMRLKGSGSVVPMFEPDRVALGLDAESLGTVEPDWGNYAAGPITLTNSWKWYEVDKADFVGEAYSLLGGEQGGDKSLDSESYATKFFFQIKDGTTADIYIDKIEFTGLLNIEEIEYKKEGVMSVEDCGLLADIRSGTVEQGVPTLIPGDYLDFTNASAPVAAAGQTTPEGIAPANGSTGVDNWLHVEGTKMYDSNNNQVRLTGVNWFGFETRALIPMGLWEEEANGRTITSMLEQMIELGFNTVRIPFSDEVIWRSRGMGGFEKLTLDTPKTFDIDLAANGLSGSDTPLDLMDKIVETAQDLGLKVILDSHSRESDGYLVEGYWFNPEFEEFGMEEWVENWEFLANRYKNNDAVIAMDLNNEPHFDVYWNDAGHMNNSIDVTRNWNRVAEHLGNAILDVNPNVMIIVEGVEQLEQDPEAVNTYWWGGNLQGVATAQIDFGSVARNSKLVYSPHEYGPEVYLQPWFKDSNFPRNLPYIWEDRFGYINTQGIGHLFIGEFGIKNNVEGSASNIWFDTFLEYMAERKAGYSWTFWAWNPNSGDTGGILGNDWNSVNQWKLDKIQHLQAPMIGNQNGQ